MLQMEEKRIIAEKAADYIVDNMVIGLGTGSTVYFTIKKIAQLVNEGLTIKGVATSKETEMLAKKMGIPIVDINTISRIDLAIDGADQFTEEFNLIKGGGGALLREKIIAHAANQFIVVADSSKRANQLGSFPLPVEVLPFGLSLTKLHLQKLGCEAVLRTEKGQPFITDNGNYIFDCHFEVIQEPEVLEKEINMIPGVIESGLFTKLTHKIITLNASKQLEILRKMS